MAFRDDAGQLKRDLTSAISKLVMEFEKDTGMSPSSIDVQITDISTMGTTQRTITGVRLRFDV